MEAAARPEEGFHDRVPPRGDVLHRAVLALLEMLL